MLMASQCAVTGASKRALSMPPPQRLNAVRQGSLPHEIDQGHSHAS